MKEEIQFRLGDSVYFPYHGYGTIIGLHNDGREYPIEVRWEASPHGQEVNTFTKDGFLTHGLAERNVPSDSKLRDQLTVVDKSPLKKAEEMKEEIKYKVGDRVYAPFHGYGVVTEIKDDEREYPITVTWDEKKHGCSASIFTPDGSAFKGLNSVDDDLTLAEKAPPKKDETEGKFKVGDRVYFPYFGLGTVTTVCDRGGYPVEVTWNNGHVTSFTSEGFPDYGDNDKLTVVGKILSKEEGTEEAAAEDNALKVGDRVWLNAIEKGTIIRFCPNEETCIVNSDLDGEVEIRMDAIEKIEDSAINPAHYQVEGIPEAIEIMEHLMAKEQLEGFLWGNILKYAYRYGRKGDKKETAGKIEWYAKKLKELDAGEVKHE